MRDLEVLDARLLVLHGRLDRLDSVEFFLHELAHPARLLAQVLEEPDKVGLLAKKKGFFHVLEVSKLDFTLACFAKCRHVHLVELVHVVLWGVCACVCT